MSRIRHVLPRVERVDEVGVAGGHCLRLTFNDGIEKTVDLLPLLQGPIFEPLLDPTYFRRVLLDPVAGTVVWPNGADIAPETLHALPAWLAPAPKDTHGKPKRPAPERRR